MKWSKVKLSEVCDINVGKTPSRGSAEFFGKGTPWVSISDMNGKKVIGHTKEEITNAGIKAANMKIIDPNTVLFSFKLSVGKVSISGVPLYTNEAIASLPIKDTKKLKPEYLYYALQAQDFSHLGERAAKGLTLNKEKLNRIMIPLPSAQIQKKIATLLDEADALRGKDKELLVKYDELLQSVFYDMFGDPVKNEKGWKITTIANIANFITSGSRGWAKYYNLEGDLFLRINNIGRNYLKLDDIVYVAAPTGSETERTRVKPNDLLLSITADLGRTAVIPENFPTAYINQHLALIRLNKTCNSFYVSQYISSEGGRKQLIKLNKGGVKAGLNFEDIKSLKILLPPIGLQNQFTAIARNIQVQKELVKQQLLQSEQLFQNLLYKAFNGELV